MPNHTGCGLGQGFCDECKQVGADYRRWFGDHHKAYYSQCMVQEDKYTHRYVLTINPGGISHDTEDCSEIVKLFNRVLCTKQLKHSHVSYAYEAYTRNDEITEENPKGECIRTYPHIHALIETNQPLHFGTLRKTTKCQTQIQRLKGPKTRWLNYLKKYKDHKPTIQLFKPYMVNDDPHVGTLFT
jgi:hypothetical protein